MQNVHRDTCLTEGGTVCISCALQMVQVAINLTIVVGLITKE